MLIMGHIYKIIYNLDNSFCYIGSTFSTLYKRFEKHKKDYKNNNGSISIHKYFDKYGIDNFKIELIKSYNVIKIHQTDFKHLCAYETLWINNTKNCVNKQLPFNPLRKEMDKQWREKNKEELAEKKKEYYDKHKKEIAKKAKEYRENHKEERKEYDKKYYEKHKKYNEKHKKEISEKNKQKFNCECGGKYTFGHKSEHFKTKKHIQFLENK